MENSIEWPLTIKHSNFDPVLISSEDKIKFTDSIGIGDTSIPDRIRWGDGLIAHKLIESMKINFDFSDSYDQYIQQYDLYYEQINTQRS